MAPRGPSDLLLTLVSTVETFLIQECFSLPCEDPPTVTLYCPSCGRNTVTDLAFVMERPGDRLGCSGCGTILRLPSIESMGV